MDDIDDFLQQFSARTKQRQAKLEQRQEVSIDSVTTMCSDKGGEVSYPPLSPLPEENDCSSIEEETDRQDESSMTDYKRENTSPSQLDYSSDLSLECDADTTATNVDFYRAEPVVCHSSPDQILQQQQGHLALRTSPRKNVAPHTDIYQHSSNTVPQAQQRQKLTNQNQDQQRQPQQQQQQQQAPLQERPVDNKITSHSLSDEQYKVNLMKKIERAEHSIKQLKKAVEISKSGSKEHIEAARLLKIAWVEHRDYSIFLETLKKGTRKKADSLGSLKLSKIEFETRTALKDDLAVEGVFHYFFCVASCCGEVKATEMIDTDSIRSQNQKDFIQFNEPITFVDLPPDFSVDLKVFEFVKKPMKLMEKTLEVFSTPKKSRATTETEFSYIGHQQLTQADRDLSQKTVMIMRESKYIKPRFKYRMELKPEQLPSKAGMLHVRRLDDGGLRPDWSRFWIDLSGGQILFWRSKQDALESVRPEHTIDLKNLCSHGVQKLVPDDDLYRQNSFVIYEIDKRRGGETDTLFQRILSDENCKITKHQFAADNKEDRDSWCYLLDKSVHCFREWNGKTRVFSPEELNELFSPLIKRN